jgi:hypothetical protein
VLTGGAVFFREDNEREVALNQTHFTQRRDERNEKLRT